MNGRDDVDVGVTVPHSCGNLQNPSVEPYEMYSMSWMALDSYRIRLFLGNWLAFCNESMVLHCGIECCQVEGKTIGRR